MDTEVIQKEEIDIKELLYLLKKKLWLILLITAIAFSGGYYQASKMQVSYKASAKVFVGKRENLVDYYDKMEMMYYTSFMDTFNEVIKLDDFISQTLDKHKINVPLNEVKNKLGFEGTESTPIFTVTYTTSKYEGTTEVLTAICEEFIYQAKSIFPDTKPQIIDTAKVSTIYPNKTRTIAIWTLIGLVLSIGLVLAMNFLDDTIKSKERLEKIIPIPVLGELPKQEKLYREGRI